MAKHSNQRADSLNQNNAAFKASADNRSNTFNPTSKAFESASINNAIQKNGMVQPEVHEKTQGAETEKHIE